MNDTQNMTRRGWIRLFSYIGALLLILVGFLLVKQHEASAYQTQLAYKYQSAYNDLSASMNNIQISLEKGIYSGTAAQISTISAQLLRDSGTAKSALSHLPAAQGELTSVSRFLSQVGDFFLTLSKKTVSGGEITQQERDSLAALYDTAVSINDQLASSMVQFTDGDGWMQEISAAAEVPEEGFGSAMLEMEETLTDYPTLIYDGPFSDHIMTRESPMLSAAQPVDRETARRNAAQVLGVDAAALADDGETEGKMPSYNFKTEDTSITVSKQGGYVVYFRKFRPVTAGSLSYEQAVEKAADYLNRMGGNTFESSYYFADEGVCVINFAHREGNTICYTDLVKVGVALDTGEIVLLESRGYLNNHRERTIGTPKYTQQQAQQVLSGNLQVQAVSLALIPSGGAQELHCYEFRCLGQDDQEVLVYVNTATLAEEEILILLKTDGGTLTK